MLAPPVSLKLAPQAFFENCVGLEAAAEMKATMLVLLLILALRDSVWRNLAHWLRKQIFINAELIAELAPYHLL